MTLRARLELAAVAVTVAVYFDAYDLVDARGVFIAVVGIGWIA